MNPALFVSSGDPLLDRRHEWARGLLERGESIGAADLLEETLKRAPGFFAGWFLLGHAQEEIGNREQALSAFRRVIALDPVDRLGAGLRIARLGEAAGAGAMSSAYVQTLFDQYAGRFDKELIEDLAYCGPKLIVAALDRVAGTRAQFGRALDLGCGTGLMGDAVRSRVKELVGVDLSEKMIAIAKQKFLYDRLAVNDLVAFIKSEDTAFDLIVAADVFVYLPDLAPVLSEAAQKLSPSGLFAFTVETHEGAGVILRDTLRFAHGEPYLRAVAETANFQLVALEKVSTRTEKNLPVSGLLVVMRKNAQ